MEQQSWGKKKSWRDCNEYISELFRENRHETINIQYNWEGPPILKEEVEDAMNNMKFGKAVGDDGIALEMLKTLGNLLRMLRK